MQKVNCYKQSVDIWFKYYSDKTRQNYLMDGTQGKHLKQLIKKVELKVIDVGMDASEENILNSLKGFLYSITDQWIIDHLDISIVNSKFNQLYVRSITGGIQSKINDKREANVRSLIEDFGERVLRRNQGK